MRTGSRSSHPKKFGGKAHLFTLGDWFALHLGVAEALSHIEEALLHLPIVVYSNLLSSERIIGVVGVLVIIS